MSWQVVYANYWNSIAIEHTEILPKYFPTSIDSYAIPSVIHTHDQLALLNFLSTEGSLQCDLFLSLYTNFFISYVD